MMFDEGLVPGRVDALASRRCSESSTHRTMMVEAEARGHLMIISGSQEPVQLSEKPNEERGGSLGMGKRTGLHIA
jgi:hypothetical protein